MKTTLILATFVATGLAIFAAIDVYAQQQPPQGAHNPSISGPVAVIDLAYVFKHHTRFNQGVSQMKTDAEAADAALKKEHARITQLGEGLKRYKVGSPDYKKAEEDMTQQQARFQASASLQKKDFQDRESKLYYATYQEVNDAVKYYADRHGINLVLQFSGDPIDPNNRQSVAGAISSLVVYQKGTDITPIILDEVNKSAAGGTARKPGPPSR